MSEPSNLQYPIGKCPLQLSLSPDERSTAIDTLAAFAEHLAAVLDGLTEPQLDTPYRPGAWTIRQLTHHISDSHVTAYTWMRLALTEDWPTVYDYNPAALAELPDSALPATVSLQLLDSVHQRWVSTLRAVEDSAWSTRGYIHPETGRCPLEQALAMYTWHSRHHLAHILNCRVLHRW
jgi:DinB superfamily